MALVNGVVNNALFHSSPHVNQTPPQIINSIMHWYTESLLNYCAFITHKMQQKKNTYVILIQQTNTNKLIAPDFVVNWTGVTASCGAAATLA